MNDWIIWGLLVLAISEIMFILLRIYLNHESWIFHKIMSIAGGFILGLIQLLIVTENNIIGDLWIFHWERLLYEGGIILAIGFFFLINYFISELINNKVAKGDLEE